MAKSLTSFFTLSTLLFVFLVLSNTFETPTMVEADDCERPSGTWSGLCFNSLNCNNQCIQYENAISGTCKNFECLCTRPC
ncbi:hypothetical protein IFM89_039251 [Coptis chinensis]|uniref:Knottins-like domain-containing protein n=1 Tax=Coptis chinensis TaxID=261450 RepID=A0A835IJZ1_9MAGN|nr:hypothetical protein IFM89_039251 [Coptis chinensis]